MKKIFVLSFAGIGMTICCQGQFLGAFFSQKKADLKALEKQLATIMVYVKQTEVGYEKARVSLGSIQRLKKSELDLHASYFESLRQVNPIIASDQKVTAISGYQEAIVHQFHQLLQQADASDDVQAEEKTYLHSVYQQILQGCSDSMDELTKATTDGTWTMTDDERLHCIDRIYVDMRNRYAFTQSITGDMGWLATQRAVEKNDIHSIHTWR